VTRLAEQGVASEPPALPSCGETGEPTGAAGPGLAEDVAAVRRVLTASDEPTVVVAHSYGGIVTAEAAAGIDAVRHLLLVSSYLPEAGQSLSSFGGEEPAPFLDIDTEAGTFTVRPDALAETFLQDCDPRIQRQAADRDVVVTKADLLIEEEMPQALPQLCAHVSSYEITAARWARGNYAEHLSVIPFPGRALREYIRDRFTQLKREQARLLGHG